MLLITLFTKQSSQTMKLTFRSISIAESLPMGVSLLYGAPNYNLESLAQVGRVFIVNVTSIPAESQNLEHNLQDISYDILEGTERMGKFGWDIAVVDINKDGLDDIAISAPSLGNFLRFYLFRQNPACINFESLLFHIRIMHVSYTMV